MRRLFAAAFAVLACTCVPPTDDRDPRGAAGVKTEPSEPTKGVPFVTDDGWTVTIDALYFRTQVLATGPAIDDEESDSGGFEQYVWNARSTQELYAPGVAEGRATVRLQLSAGYVPRTVEAAAPNELFRGVPDAVRERFIRSEDADSGFFLGSEALSSSPAVVMVATGEKGGRRVVVDVAFATSSISARERDLPVDVVRDDVRYTPLRVEGEQLFRFGADGVSRFQPFADTEADQTPRTGRVTGRELAQVVLPCRNADGGAPQPGGIGEGLCVRSVLDLLRFRAPAMIGQPPLEPGFLGGADEEDLGPIQVPEANP